METKTFNFSKNDTEAACNCIINFCTAHCCRIDLSLAHTLALQVVLSNNDLHLSKRSFALVGGEENGLAECDYILHCRTNYFNGEMRITLITTD